MQIINVETAPTCRRCTAEGVGDSGSPEVGGSHLQSRVVAAVGVGELADAAADCQRHENAQRRLAQHLRRTPACSRLPPLCPASPVSAAQTGQKKALVDWQETGEFAHAPDAAGKTAGSFLPISCLTSRSCACHPAGWAQRQDCGSGLQGPPLYSSSCL